jgi:hypothetical protein
MKSGSMTTFEVHIFKNGTWCTNSIFDDKDLALFEARRMKSSPRYKGIRVIEEIFDELGASSRIRTIFRDACINETPKAAIARKKRVETLEKYGKSRERSRKRKRISKSDKETKITNSKGTEPLVLYALICVLLLALMYLGIEHLKLVL